MNQVSGQEAYPFMTEEEVSMDLIGKEPKLLNIGIVGYGPAGIISAIVLSKQGHQVTIFEKDFYNWKDRALNESDKAYMYPMVLGQKAMKAVNYIGALPIFAKYLNQVQQIEDNKGNVLNKEPIPVLNGCRQEIMWALGESLETLAPDVKVKFNTGVESIDCSKTELKTSGDHAGTYTFDLIIGADGVGSVVRKAMCDQFEEITATRVTGEEYCYTFYMDNHEVVSKMNPNKLHFSDLTGYATVHTTLKHADNKEGCAIVNMNQDIKSVEHAKKILKGINPIFVDAMSEERLKAFANFKKKNVGKKCWVSQYYHGDNFLLLGDAAHPFRPIGQGINIAMLEGVWLDQALKSSPHDIARALKRHGEYAKMQGDACINLSQVMTFKPRLLREFVNYGLGIQDFPIINVYLAHKDADYNAVWKIYDTQNRMWGLFLRFYIIWCIGLVLAMGSNWFEGLKFVGISNCFLISRFFWAASRGPPKPLMVPSCVLFLVGLFIISRLKSVQELIFEEESTEQQEV